MVAEAAAENTVVEVTSDQFFAALYADKCSWEKAAAQQASLREWATAACEKYHCTVHEIAITANYW